MRAELGTAAFITGTLLARALMTMPKLEREPLMAVISLKRSPWDWLLTMRSLPAKSTRHKVAARENSRQLAETTPTDGQVRVWMLLLTLALHLSAPVNSFDVQLED